MELYNLLKDTSHSRPDKLAVICGRFRYTYAQLKDRTDRLADALLSLGVRKDVKVAVIHKNCHIFLECYFAAAKIGAVLVPVNIRLTPREMIYILNDSQAEVLIVEPEFLTADLLEKKEIIRLKQVILTRDTEKVSSCKNFFLYEDLIKKSDAGENRETDLRDSDTAQIYYTSGTTGKPKGVILTHRNNLKHALGAIEELNISSADNWLHVSPMFHLADAWAVWAMTQAGATHVFVPCFEPLPVLQAIQEHRVTLSNFIPTMLNLLVKNPEIERFDLTSFRLVLSGGAPIAKEIVKTVLEKFGCDYIQTYGLTETSPFLTLSKLREDMDNLSFEDKLRFKVTTGRPFSGVQLKVVREDGAEVQPDEKEVGEIIVKGETITPGYWQLPQETTRRIVDGWLHTRDLAVINPEGYITLVDRMDDRIITGGENVFSIEVEDVLYSHPGILEAAVIGLPDAVWGEIVTAVVVLKKGERIGEDDIVQYCRKRLAPFKSPKKVFFSNSLPKTGSAKIYKYKLREHYTEE
ncbi:MAG: long-chain-fatty-acid--CoA ligase [Candidatus Aminicenantes bacterium]|jgi:acyl-CoA synthetase (AMP-forming)/AMP-acid ligase II